MLLRGIGGLFKEQRKHTEAISWFTGRDYTVRAFSVWGTLEIQL